MPLLRPWYHAAEGRAANPRRGHAPHIAPPPLANIIISKSRPLILECRDSVAGAPDAMPSGVRRGGIYSRRRHPDTRDIGRYTDPALTVVRWRTARSPSAAASRTAKRAVNRGKAREWRMLGRSTMSPRGAGRRGGSAIGGDPP